MPTIAMPSWPISVRASSPTCFAVSPSGKRGRGAAFYVALSKTSAAPVDARNGRDGQIPVRSGERYQAPHAAGTPRQNRG